MELKEASKALTAITVGHIGFCEYDQMPFGLINTLAMFQHLMETCLCNLQFKWCIICLDDIIVFAATLKEHLERLHAVFSQLWTARLKLQPARCKFFKVSVVYLGHEISKECVWTDGHKIKAIKPGLFPSWLQSWEASSDSHTTIDASLRVMLKLLAPSMITFPATMQLIRNEKLNGGLNAIEAFVMLKVLCTSAPILAFADFTKLFKLHTDASTVGLGAVLYQEQDGKERVIMYAGKSSSRVILISQHIDWNS